MKLSFEPGNDDPDYKLSICTKGRIRFSNIDEDISSFLKAFFVMRFIGLLCAVRYKACSIVDKPQTQCEGLS